MKQIPNSVVCKLIAKAIPRPPGAGVITPEMNLRTNLGVDSLGLMSIVFVLEEDLRLDLFQFSTDFVQAVNVADIIAIVNAGVESQA